MPGGRGRAKRDAHSPKLLLSGVGMPMRRKVVDYGLLQVRFPEIVNAQATFWVARISPILYVLVHLVTSPLPQGLVGITATVGIIHASLDHLVSRASAAVDPSQVLIGC